MASWNRWAGQAVAIVRLLGDLRFFGPNARGKVWHIGKAGKRGREELSEKQCACKMTGPAYVNDNLCRTFFVEYKILWAGRSTVNRFCLELACLTREGAALTLA